MFTVNQLKFYSELLKFYYELVESKTEFEFISLQTQNHLNVQAKL